MKHSVRNAFRSFAAFSALTVGALAFGAGCSSSIATPELPSGAQVKPLLGLRSVVSGTVVPGATNSPSCDPVSATAAHLVQLEDDALMTIALRPTADGEPLRGATLHVTHLDSKRTWCAPMDDSGLAAEVGGDLHRGIYAVSVTEAATGHTMPYEIVFRKL